MTNDSMSSLGSFETSTAGRCGIFVADLLERAAPVKVAWFSAAGTKVGG